MYRNISIYRMCGVISRKGSALTIFYEDGMIDKDLTKSGPFVAYPWILPFFSHCFVGILGSLGQCITRQVKG